MAILELVRSLLDSLKTVGLRMPMIPPPGSSG
jgi:hypothetical protein